MPHTSDCPVFKTVTMPCQTKQKNFTFLGLVAVILNLGHTHYNRSYTNPIQIYTAYNLYTVTPQLEGPKNTLTKCICTPPFLHNSLLKYCHKFLFYASYETLTVGGKQIQYSALSRSSYF